MGMTPTHDHAAAVDFLRHLQPEGPWLLTAIPVDRAHPDSKAPPTRTFVPGEDAAVVEWLDSRAGGEFNYYFSVNPPNQAMSKKARRLDIKEMRFLHVDLDPRAREDLDAERARIEHLLLVERPEGIPEPTAVTDSGGGCWAFWRLDEPYEIRRSEERYEEAKLWNLQLELTFGADSCHNVDRIARLPGTVNWPDEKKQAKGRVARLARSVHQSDASYDLGSFSKAPQVQAKRDGFGQGTTVSISENVKRLATLDELPSSVPDFTKVLIAQGQDPDDPGRFESRSEPLWHVVCELVRADCDDDTIYAVITDPDWGISASVVDGSNGRPDGYARRQIERAREFAIDPKLADLNGRYAVVQNAGGGRCRIIYEEQFEGHAVLVTQSPSDFRAFYSNEFVTVPMGNAAKQVPLGHWWFAHPKRRSYRAIVFQPGKEVPTDVYNLWRGFAVEARPGGSCEMYLAHVRDCICSGNEELYEYVVNWMATAVQKPWEQGHTAIVLRGPQGAGKGTFAKGLLGLFGRHGKQITDPKHLVGNFNSHLRDCIVLFADEAIAASSRQQEGILKTLVTEESLMFEAKGVDAAIERNYLHVIMASNNNWVVPAGVDDRRFVVLDVDESRMQDLAYFSAMRREMANGGQEALLHMLATRNLSSFNPRDKPTTAALQEQKLLSLSPIAKWWHSVLSDGTLGDVSLVESVVVPTGYVSWDHNKSVVPGMRVSNFNMRGFLEEAVGGSVHRRQATAREMEQGELEGEQLHAHTGEVLSTKRPNVYVLPALAELREAFDKTHGGPYPWDAEPESESKPKEPF